MRLPSKFSISTKLLLVISAIMLAITIPLAFQTGSLFKTQSEKREEALNMADATSRSHEINSLLANIRKKVYILGALLLSPELDKSKNLQEILQSLFISDEDILAFRFYKVSGGKQERIRSFVNEERLEQLEQDKDYLQRLDQAIEFPVHRVLKGEFSIYNRSLRGGLAVLTLGVPLAQDENGHVSHYVLADIKQASFQKSFSIIGERRTYLIDEDGTTLAHPHEPYIFEMKNLQNLEIVKKALESKITKGQIKYRSEEDGQSYFGAFAHTEAGPIVITEAPEAILLEPAYLIRQKVYYLTGIILSISLILIFLFSLTLTRPIIKLSEIALKIGKGDFNIPVTKLIRSRDEVGALAVSVENMLGGLKERDKVKNILTKFHGTTIAQDLISLENIERQGVRKNIAILFSDIRGFTTLSENTSPEEVVSLLNEYFASMVHVITKHNGVIDKFIGDAIMAIWGVPQERGNEQRDCVTAAIEMRQALKEFNEKMERNGKPQLKIGIGLHYGPCVSGIIGSEERLEYTVIGDTVNVCSRVESLTKEYKWDILVTDTLRNYVANLFNFEEVGETTVKGKAKPVKVFKVL
ncbi:MAG: HAMP domain-containing protein [Deltaproteobacteria bacterium]|nr:HAMP domain-containing protein [Deltaproteobacteria bacterium]